MYNSNTLYYCNILLFTENYTKQKFQGEQSGLKKGLTYH